ncbi:MAG: cytochrome c-type biogenesis protein CcmH [Acidobacteriaceae bacterium]
MRRISRIVVVGLALCLVAGLGMGAADAGARFNDLTTKLMCTCGCGQTLATCNHLGCSSLAREGGELKTAIDRGDSDNTILIAFQNEYGPTVLSAPLLTRFNVIAWVVPPLFLGLGLVGAFVLVRRWRRRVAAQPAVEHGAGFEAMRERVRRETEQ